MSRTGTGKMGEAQITSAYLLHTTGGYSLRKLADSLWQGCGYKSPEACRSSLRVAFNCRKFEIRARSAAMVVHHAQGVVGARRKFRKILQRETDPEWVTAQLETIRFAAMPELAALIDEQDRDAQVGTYSRNRWELSLDARVGDDGRLIDFVDECGNVSFGHRHTVDFTHAACADMDRRREIDAFADEAVRGRAA